MGIFNIGIGIRSNSQNGQFGNLSTQPVITPDIANQIRNAPATSAPLQVSAQNLVQNNIVVNAELREAATRTPTNLVLGVPGSAATTLAPRVGFQNTIRNNTDNAKQLLFKAADTLQLSNNVINVSGFNTSSLNGFSNQRPEIIALVDYEPLFENKQTDLKFTKTGYFVDYKYQLQELRKNTVQNLLSNISKNEITKKELQTQIKQYDEFLKKEEDTINLLGSVIDVFDLFDRAFQVREIPNTFFSINGLLGIKDFFVTKMGYNPTSFNTFSDTKILYQMLLDLRNASEDYSINLLNLTDPNRINDLNSVNVDTSYTKTNGFNFSIKASSSPFTSTEPRSGLTEQVFNSFLNSLPQVPMDRIKLLAQVLNRVLRVSRGMSKKSVRDSLTTNFSVSDDFNPFDNIFGSMPKDIFTQPLGVNTIASSLYLVNSQNPGVVILPFENSVVDDGETTYVPGNLFFKSTTIANNSIQSLVQYAEDISRKITNTVDISNDIFDFYNRSYGLLPNNYIQKFLGVLKSSLSYINTYQSSGNPSKESLIIPALINYSQTDRTLKYYLFQFVLLLGLCSITNTTDKKLFRNLKTELKTTLKFSNLPFREILLDVNIDQSSDLRGAALAMAREITRYVTQTLIENSSLTLDENASLTPRPRTDGNQNLFLENPEMISRVLIDTVNSSVSNRPNLFKDFVDLASSLDQDASIAGSQDSWLNANLTTSRYSNISISYLLLYLFELICSFTKRYFNVNFDVENGKLFGIVYNKEDCLCALKGVENAIKEIPSSLLSFPTEIRVDLASNASQNSSVSLDTLGLILTYTPEQLRKINEYYDVTKKLANALIDEDTFLKNILGIFGVISTNLSNAKRIGISLYNSLTPAQSDLLRRNANMLKKAQFRIAKTTFDNIKAAKDSNINSLAFNITDDEYYHLLSLSKEMKAEDGERTKLVAVGLPNGFIDSIKGRASKTAAISGAEQIVDLSSTTGIISIAIYRKSLLDEEIIYKPKRFIFDTSLIVNKYQESLTIDPFTSFGEQNGLITLTDLESVKSPKTLTKSSVGNYSKYNTILSNEEKQQMITNHIEDFLFKKYMALYNGIQISEEVFPIAEYQFRNNVNDQAQQFMRLVLQTFGISDSRPIKDILADEATPIAVKDSMSLIKNSISFMDMETLDSVIMSEKLFDKIFVVKINIDKDFEIDTTLTRRQVLQNESIIKRIYKIGEKTFLKDLDGSIMDEFYATIEVLG